MKLPNRIAVRYIFTKRSFHFISVITLISAVGIIIGVAVLISVTSIFNGFREYTESQLISLDPHIRIVSPDGSGINNPSGIIENLKKINGIKAISPVIQSRVIIVKGANMKVMLLNFVKSNEIRSVSGIAENIAVGKFYLGKRLERFGIVLGAGLSSTIKAMPGDSVSVLTFENLEKSVNQFSLQPGIPAYISGIFQTHNQEYDGLYSYISSAALERISPLSKDNCTSLDIRVEELNKVESIRKEIHSSFPSLVINTWWDLHKELFNVMQFERKAVFVILSLIIIIAVFNIFASLAMTVVEKKHDISLLKALGATNQMIRSIYLREGIIIGSISTITGSILGVAFCLVQEHYGLIKLSTQKFLLKSIPISLHYTDVIFVIIFSIILCSVAALYPAHKASRNIVSEGLREE